MIGLVDYRPRKTESNMPKRTPRTQDDAQKSVRKQALTLDTLRAQMKQVKDALASIALIVNEAESHNIPAIEPDGATQMEKAAQLLEGFSDNLIVGYNRARRQAMKGDEEN